MDNLQKIALLIDADNTQINKIESVIREISARGRIVVKRAYGNWKKAGLKNWEEEIKKLAINATQQFDYVSGKNATDMALVIDAMDMLYKDIYDAFVIVASDSDYTPLAIRIHESGVYVIGVGEKKTPAAFRNACDEFVFLENLDAEDEVKKTPKTRKKKPAKKVAGKKAEAETEIIDEGSGLEEVHELLKIACDKYSDDDNYCKVSSAGAYIKRAMPDFDSRNYGYSKLVKLISDFPDRYEVKSIKTSNNSSVVTYTYKE
ncbi:MAG: NYN domain-containing protein [Saccharofermentans sp.]|nr:NYN domain-containing protein [Saccharofermentans sp.]